MRRHSLALIVLSPLLIGACDLGPNGYGTAPPGVSQAEWDAKIATQRKAEYDYIHGNRGGSR
ncbi:hypothetical protein AB1M95_18815 [Sulfitobacter sp. LCG007]